MIEQAYSLAAEMTPLEVAENVAFFLFLILALLCIICSSSPMTRYFIPVVCLLACGLLLVYWVEHGNEPEILSPIVRVISHLFA